MKIWKQWKFLQSSFCWSSHQRGVAGKLAARLWTWIRTASWRPEIIQTVLQRWFEDCWKKDKSSLHLMKKKDQMKWRIYVGRVLGNTKIGPVLDVKVCFQQKRYGIEIMIESLSRDRTVSWVRIVNRINKNVTETSETISLENDEHRGTGKHVAKAKPRPKFVVTLSPISIPVRERKWIDSNPERFRQDCFTVSKRHDKITATWSINSSRRWWSSAIWRDYERIQGKVRWCFAVVK